MNHPYLKPVLSKDQTECRFNKDLRLRAVPRNEDGCESCYFKQRNIDCDASIPCFSSERIDMRDITWQ